MLVVSLAALASCGPDLSEGGIVTGPDEALQVKRQLISCSAGVVRPELMSAGGSMDCAARCAERTVACVGRLAARVVLDQMPPHRERRGSVQCFLSHVLSTSCTGLLSSAWRVARSRFFVVLQTGSVSRLVRTDSTTYCCTVPIHKLEVPNVLEKLSISRRLMVSSKKCALIPPICVLR